MFKYSSLNFFIAVFFLAWLHEITVPLSTAHGVLQTVTVLRPVYYYQVFCYCCCSYFHLNQYCAEPFFKAWSPFVNQLNDNEYWEEQISQDGKWVLAWTLTGSKCREIMADHLMQGCQTLGPWVRCVMGWPCPPLV